MLRGLRGLQLIGGDVCEVSPPLDPTGHTALNAANLMFEILCGGRRRGTAPDVCGRCASGRVRPRWPRGCVAQAMPVGHSLLVVRRTKGQGRDTLFRSAIHGLHVAYVYHKTACKAAGR
jgi:hypothetical protein